MNADQVLKWLQDVPDPEIPVLSVVDLGIVRGVTVSDQGVEVEVVPTYSGCPATEVIEKSIESALLDRGLSRVTLKRLLSPAWTSDWISDEGRNKLQAYGIAPPDRVDSKRDLMGALRPVKCPQCASMDTNVISEFGSTACKASYRCNTCLEPFEYFKCI